MRFVLTTSRGTEEVLGRELLSLGLPNPTLGRGFVSLEGGLEVGYRACLHSRVASRVLLTLGRFPATDARALYDGVRELPWEEHIDPRRTIAVDFVGGSEQIRHSVFGAQQVKDAICDRLRDRRGARPSVDLTDPDVRVHVHLGQPGPMMEEEQATVSIDLSGEALHYRSGRNTGTASLKETLAAALLWMVDWPTLAATGAPFQDPLCGSGTLVLEAAGMALQRAPGLSRVRWGFSGWMGHEDRRWRELQGEAQGRALRRGPLMRGTDADLTMVGVARKNAVTLGLDEHVGFQQRSVAGSRPPSGAAAGLPGLVVTNPPYGARLGDLEGALAVSRELGDTLRQHFLGWTAGVLCGSPEQAGALGLKPRKRHVVFNGPIECRLIELAISPLPPSGLAPGWRRPV